MARRYTTTSEDLNEPRVYVNNMNTLHPTVEIPPRPPKVRPDNNTNSNNNNNNNNTSSRSNYGSARGGGGDTGGGGGGGGAVPHVPILLPLNRKNAPDAAAGATAASQQQVLHPNLENMYKKIMRKLQKELNYEETVRVPLSTQYGIEEEQEEGEGAHAAADTLVQNSINNTAGAQQNKKQNNNNSPLGSSSPLSSTIPQVEGSDNNNNNKNKNCNETPLKRVNSSAPGNPTSSMDAAAASRDPSSVIRYRASPPPSAAGAAAASVGVSGGAVGRGLRRDGAGGGEEDEEWLAAQPCPRTLRLVLAHVCETIEKKMSFAEQGSMQDCVRFTFESRSLLDRLLKELPYYTQFQESDIPAMTTEGGGGNNSKNNNNNNNNNTAAGMQKLLHELRKSPVPMPRAQFLLGAQSGGVRAVLDLTEERALQQQQQQQQQQNNSNNNNNNNNADGVGSRLPALPPLLSTAGRVQFVEQEGQPSVPGAGLNQQYGVLADQLRGNETLNNNNNNNNVGTTVNAMNGLTLPETYGKSLRLLNKNNANNASTANSVLSSLAGGASDGAAANLLGGDGSHHNDNNNNSIPGADSSTTDNNNKSSNNNSIRRGGGPDALGGTQLMSVGTMTEENETTMVTREAYEALAARVRELDVQRVESERLREQLDNRLLEEGDYNKKKAGVIEYLRATLLKECNTLRAQLRFAAQKEHYMQEAISAQQQQIASAAAGGAAPAAAGAATGAHGHRGNERSMMLGRSAYSLAQSTRRLNTNNNNTSAMMQRSRGNVYSGNSVTNVGMLRSTTNPNNNMSSTNMQTAGSSTSPEDQAHELSGGVDTDDALNASHLVTHDITSIHSLLDLALLAIEKDEKFTLSTDMLQANREMLLANDHYLEEGGGMGLGSTLSLDQQKQLLLEKDPKQQLDELRMAFEDKQRKLKYNYIAAQMQHQEVLGAKDHEIARLTYLTNTDAVAAALHERTQRLKSDLRHLKNGVAEQCRNFHVTLQNANHTLLARAALLDKTLGENAALLNTQEAYMDLVASATSLLSPMLTTEYPRGYHPWPLKVRNSADPFAHLIQVRYGSAEVLRLRESINLMDDLYLQLHSYASRTLVVPDRSRPAVGRALYTLCCGLLLSPQSNSELFYEVRTRYSAELAHARRIAQLHFKYMFNMHMQQTLADRAVNALLEAGMDPCTTSLPVSRRINELAAAREVLARQLADLKRERQDNAREVYRLWKDRNIDIQQGYPTPLVQKQLTLMSDAQAAQLRAKGATSGVRMQPAGGRAAAAAAAKATKASSAAQLSAEEKATERMWWKQAQAEQQAKDKSRRARVSQVEAMLRASTSATDSNANSATAAEAGVMEE